VTEADQILAMLKQESAYRCIDYLSLTSWEPSKRGKVDEFCREQICEWTYRVVDHFRIDREVAVVSINYLDRFLSVCHCDRSGFKLAATATLYMAVKVIHPQKLGDMGVLSDLSRGEFTMLDVAEMERTILRELNWKLHAPTPAALSMMLIDYLDLDFTPYDLEDLYSNTAFFSELSVCDYYFTKVKPSTVALACVLNALEGMMKRVELKALYKFHISTRDLSNARNRLWELYERSEECAIQNDILRTTSHNQSTSSLESIENFNSSNNKSSNSTSSPVSVASERCTGIPEPAVYGTSKRTRQTENW